METLRIALMACLVASCATAASEQERIVPTADASEPISSFPDATPFPDADLRQPDAAPNVVYDAAPAGTPDGGLFCESSSVCGSGECCFSLGGPGFCVPGEEVIGVCLPD